MNRRVAPIIIALLVIMTGVVLVVGLSQQKQRDKTTAPNALTISNVGQHGQDLAADQVSEIEEQVYLRLRDVVNNPADSYVATIRKDTYKKTTDEYTMTDPATEIPHVQFVLDIPAAKLTFGIDYSGGPEYAIDMLYVNCPTPSQLIYPAFACKDDV